MTKRVTALLVFLAALIFYLSFNADIPITDPVESNYALTAKEMVMSGDWLSPRIYGHYWFDKPIMIYWLIALSFKVFGITEFAARLPAAVFSAGSVAFVYWFGQKLFEHRRTALLSALALGTSLEFWVLAKMIITDAVLFFFTSVSLATFYLGLRNRKTTWYILAYGAAGMAVLTKGPVGLVLPGLIVMIYIVLTRQWQLFKELFIIPGILIFLAVTGPWYFKMYQLHGSEFINTFLGLHNYVRATVSEHPDDNVFYYYLVLFPISLLPWTGILFRYMSIFKKERTSAHLMYLTIWPVVMIGFYTMMATKYPTYVFPASFPTALLIGYTLNKMYGMEGRKVWWCLSLPILLLIGVISLSSKLFPATNWTVIYSCGIFSTCLILWLQVKGNVYYLPKTVGIVTVIMSLLLVHNGLVPLSAARSAKNIALLLPAQGAMVASYGDYSTSSVFYSGYNMPRLVREQQNTEQGTWSGKYTMPTQEIGVFDQATAQYKMSYLLVNNKSKTAFMSETFSKNFQPVATSSNITLYQRVFVQ
ncbi:ArnT family glycosyltransferase [Pelosinus sp. sgz500959]|uniref:ArnT family glycosyltransferase n=1 Tax=Pelosinus sp. sgz500959 TaxID=3242472 RepID=UPI00366B10F2